jgi:putative Mg2+ transporter-C (MgtC) family protein
LFERIVDTLLLEFAGLVGRQRERMRKAAGARTHMLVAMGAALFVLVPEQGGMALADLSRVVQGIIAGMGFLGAGAILKNQSELSIVGLTTAAGVWMTAAIGVACGLGRESTALISTVLVLFVFAVVPKVTAPSES